MENRIPLKYRISSWRQLPGCLSNNSNHLSIRVTDFIQDRRLSGLRISVEHETFGVLFACIVNANGNMISKNFDGAIHEISPSDIIAELHKFGYNIEYHPAPALSGDQITFLMTLKKLNYDKIRKLSVWKNIHGNRKEFKTYVVAFRIAENSQWLNANYSPPESEFIEAIAQGTAFNISKVSEASSYEWSWMENMVINIDDVLSDVIGGGIAL